MTDQAYIKASWDEHRLLQMEASSKQRTHALLQNEIDDMFAKEAEAHVHKTSPICAQEAAKRDIESALPVTDQQPNYDDDDSMEIASFNDDSSSSSSSNNNNSGNGAFADVESATKYGYGDDTTEQSTNSCGNNGESAPQQSSNPYGYGDDELQQKNNNPYGYGDDQQGSNNSHSNPDGDAQRIDNGDDSDPYGYGNMEIENEDSSSSVKSDPIQQNCDNARTGNIDSYKYGDLQMEAEDSTTSFGYEEHNRNVQNQGGRNYDDSCGYNTIQTNVQNSLFGNSQQLNDQSIMLEKGLAVSGGHRDSGHRINSDKNNDARTTETLPVASEQQRKLEKKNKDDKTTKKKTIEDEEHLKQDIIAQIERVEAELEAARMTATCNEAVKANASRKGGAGTNSLRLTFFTGESMPSTAHSGEQDLLSQQAPSQDQATFNLDDTLGNMTSPTSSRTAGEEIRPQPTTRPAFNLEEILNSVTLSKKQSSRSSMYSTFDVNSVLSNITSSSGITKSLSTEALTSRENFSLDNILGNVSLPTNVAKKSPTGEALKSSHPSSKSSFSLDNILGNVSTSTRVSQKGKTSEISENSKSFAQPAFSLDNILGNVSASASVSRKKRGNETAAFSLDNVVGNVASLTMKNSQDRTMEKLQSIEKFPELNVDIVMENVSASVGTLTGSSPASNDNIPTTETAPEMLTSQNLSHGSSKHNPKLVPMKRSEEESNPGPKKRRGRRGSTSFESGPAHSQEVSQEESQNNSVGSNPSEKSMPASQRRGRRGSTSFESRNVSTTSISSHPSIVGVENASFGTPVSGTPTSPNRAKRCFSMGDIPYGGTELTAPPTVGDLSSDHSKSSQRRRRYLRGYSMSSTTSSDGFSRLSATGASVTNYVKTHVLMINDHSDAADDDSLGDGNFIANKVTRRKLTPEEKEQLRCIGLDAFMTLRFLKFGFDVFFWPMLLSIFTLIPVYKTAAFQADVVGFFSTTIISLVFNDEYWRYWIVMAFAALHFCYILRRLWIEWEVFLPLRYDFLENGDFEKERYKEQYRKTCLVEFIPKEYKQDKSLHEFFDSISPGEIERAEVLLNTEYLRSLIKEKMKHIVAYEDVYAKKVHLHANYLRTLRTYQWGDAKKNRCCRSKKLPQVPIGPTVRAEKATPAFGEGKTKKQYIQVCALKYHFE